MKFYHVLGQVGQVGELYMSQRVLFKDLTYSELRKRFIKPYEIGEDFLSENNEIISFNDLRSLEIIRTQHQSYFEQTELRRKRREEIEKLYGSDSGMVDPNIGKNIYHDLKKVGENVNGICIKGPPGYKARRCKPSIKAIAWVSGIVASVIAAGIVKWLDWL